jgi:uncharacterized protein (DUF433 family)
MTTRLRGVIHGKLIELEEEAGLPEGQQVSIQIESLAASGNWLDRIVVDPAVLQGRPIVKGTRISAEELAGLLSQGQTEEDLRRSFPELTVADIAAVREFASVPAGIRRSFGGWAEDSHALDEFLGWNRQQRKQQRDEAIG